MTAAFLGAVFSKDLARAGRLADVRLPDRFPVDEDELRFLRDRLREMVQDVARSEWLAPRMMVVREGRRLAGHLGFHGPPGEDGRVEVGYGVLPEYRRQGYAVEACRGLFAWAARERGVTRFRAAVSPANAASLAVVRRLGFRQTGVQIDPEDGEEQVFEMELAEEPSVEPGSK